MLQPGLVLASLSGRRRCVLLEQMVPVTRNLEHDLRVDAATRGSLLDGQAGLLQHGVALLLALLDSPLDFIRVQGSSVW